MFYFYSSHKSDKIVSPIYISEFGRCIYGRDKQKIDEKIIHYAKADESMLNEINFKKMFGKVIKYRLSVNLITFDPNS